MADWGNDPIQGSAAQAAWGSDPLEGANAEAPVLPLPSALSSRPPPPLVEHPEYDTGREMGAGLSNVQNRIDETLRLAKVNSSNPAEEARKNLSLARDLDLGPEIIAGKAKEFEAVRKQEEVEHKLRQLPTARLQQWMAESSSRAAAIQNELDSWGTLDYIFGKFISYGDSASRTAEIINKKGRPSWSPEIDRELASLHADRGRYERPGWYQAYGRAMYSTATSLQSWFMSMYGPTKDTGKSLDEIKRQRDWAHFPIPGDTVYVQDGEAPGGARALGKERPVLSRVNSLVGMVPIITAGAIHPLAGAALIYSETAGRTYEDLRLEGWDHEHAANISEMIGFSLGAIGMLTGPLFKYSFLPKATQAALGTIPNAALSTAVKNPTFWRAALGLGKNFLWSTGMNMAMASSEVAIKEAFDSARAGRPYDASKVASAAHDASGAWAEMLTLSVIPAYEEHLARKRGVVAEVYRTQEAADRAKFAEAVYNNYEERGRALRSMHEASRIVAAVEALKDSEFMRSNPEDARELINTLVSPRESQTVYVRPEAVAKLPPDMADLLGHDPSLGADDGRIPVNFTDLIMHPDGPALARQAAGEQDLLTPGEVGSYDFGQPHTPMGADVPDHRLAEFIEQERRRLNDRRSARMPTEEEINSAIQGVPPPTTGRRPAPDTGPRSRPAAPTTPLPPVTEAGLRRWALDAVSRLPTGELAPLAEERGRRAEAATREALEARAAATEHARGGRAAQTDASEGAAVLAERRAAIHGALSKAAAEGVEEIRKHVDYFGRQASDEPLPGGGMSARAASWYAGEEFGAAHDAILEKLGLSKPRGAAAPDLSDAYDKLARLRMLSRDQFDGWDLRKSNLLLRETGTMPERSLDDLRTLRSALEQISQGADAENSVRVFGIRVAKEMMREEIAEHLKSLPDVPPGQRMLADNERALSGPQAADKGRGGVKASLNQPITLMLKLGRVGESLYFESYVPGKARKAAMWGDVLPIIEGIDRGVPDEIRKLGRDKVTFLDGELHLRSDVWDMVLKLGTKGADTKIAQSMGFKDQWDKGAVVATAEQKLWDWVHRNIAETPEQAKTIMEKLVVPHWRLHENRLWPEYERMFRERGLAPPEKLQPRKVTIHGEEYQGSYGGRLKWLEAKNKPVVHPGSLEALLDSDVSGPYTDQRHLAERDPDFSGKPLFSWDGVVSDIKKEIHDIAMRPFVEDAHKVFSDPAIRQLVGNKLGKQALNEIYDPGGQSSWLHAAARGSVADVHSAKAWAQILFKFQGLAAYSAFSANMRVMTGQLSHIPAAMFGLGIEPAAVTEGFAAAFNPDRRAWAHAASEVLRLRYEDYESRAIELTKQLTGLEPGRDVVRRTTDHANWMAWREMDAFLSHAIWEASYSDTLHGLGKAATHEQAVRAADVAVTRMMPAQDVYDQSAFVRDRSLAGFSYMVRNFPNTLANVAALNWWGARLKGGALTLEGAAARAKVSAQFVGMVLAAEILGKGFIMQGGPRDRDDAESWYRARLFGAMTYPYMISEPVVAGVHALSGDRHAARQEMDRMMPASIGVLTQGIDDIGRFTQGGDDEAALRAAAHLSGLMLRTPLPSILYNLSNAGRNAEDPLDAAMKAMGYRR